MKLDFGFTIFMFFAGIGIGVVVTMARLSAVSAPAYHHLSSLTVIGTGLVVAGVLGMILRSR